MVREHITKNELREQKLSLETSKDHSSGPLDPEKMKEIKEKELKHLEKKEKKRKKDFEKKFKQMIETSAHMDHFRQDDDIYDKKDEQQPDSHTLLKNLTENKKSWFNQDIFKEINASLEEHYSKTDIGKNNNSKKIKNKKNKENASVSDDDDDDDESELA